MKKIEKIMEKLEDFIIYAIMILAFLNYNSLTQQTIVVSIFIWPTVFLSGICILYRIIKYKNYQENNLFKYLVVFIISYIISSLLNIKYGYYQNFRTLMLMVIMIAVVYIKTKNVEKKDKQIKRYCIAFIGITTFLSAITLLIFNINQIFINIGGESLYITGLRWGRLKGAYNDFNYGGIINSLAIIMAMYFFIAKKRKETRILCVLSMLINFSFIALSDSRTALLALLSGIMVFIFAHSFNSDKKAPSKIIKFLVITGLSVVIVFGRKNFDKKSIYKNI